SFNVAVVALRSRICFASDANAYGAQACIAVRFATMKLHTPTTIPMIACSLRISASAPVTLSFKAARNASVVQICTPRSLSYGDASGIRSAPAISSFARATASVYDVRFRAAGPDWTSNCWAQCSRSVETGLRIVQFLGADRPTGTLSNVAVS
ncbi:hypothetical protein Vretifemale_18966, partial [Volvox reticuliferus]